MSSITQPFLLHLIMVEGISRVNLDLLDHLKKFYLLKLFIERFKFALTCIIRYQSVQYTNHRYQEYKCASVVAVCGVSSNSSD